MSLPKKHPSWLTQDFIKSRLKYNPETGEMTWLPTIRGRYAGLSAGSFDGIASFVRIRHWGVCHKLYAARVAWLYMTGEYPGLIVDHIDGDSANNAWSNLRLVTVSQNAKNAKKSSRNTSGTGCVYYNKVMCKWVAQVVVNDKRVTEYYYNKDLAIRAAYHLQTLAQDYTGRNLS